MKGKALRKHSRRAKTAASDLRTAFVKKGVKFISVWMFNDLEYLIKQYVLLVNQLRSQIWLLLDFLTKFYLNWADAVLSIIIILNIYQLSKKSNNTISESVFRHSLSQV